MTRRLVEAHGLAGAELERPLVELRDWLGRAAHEAEHGPETFLDMSVRFNREMLPYLKRLAAGERGEPGEGAGRCWSEELGWHKLGDERG